ncbi:MAG: MerR family transcriptional regulator [Solirubrobacteraceae bacterium]
MSPTPVATRPLRIGDVARAVDTTTRTIRYYEEIGLLGPADRPAGGHRAYAESDVERLREIIRLKRLLGVSLEELKQLVEAQDARAALRAEWRRGARPLRRRDILTEALGHIDSQLTLVRRRRREIERLEDELTSRRRRLRGLLRELDERRSESEP